MAVCFLIHASFFMSVIRMRRLMGDQTIIHSTTCTNPIEILILWGWFELMWNSVLKILQGIWRGSLDQQQANSLKVIFVIAFSKFTFSDHDCMYHKKFSVTARLRSLVSVFEIKGALSWWSFTCSKSDETCSKVAIKIAEWH